MKSSLALTGERTMQKIVSRKDGLIDRRIGEEIIILSTDGRKMHMLNETASLIWKCISSETTLDAVVDRMCETFEVSREKAETDVLKTLEEMRKKELVCE